MGGTTPRVRLEKTQLVGSSGNAMASAVAKEALLTNVEMEMHASMCLH